MSARAAITLLSCSVAIAPGVLATETEFCDALRAIENDIRADFADNGSASVTQVDQALTQLIGTSVAGFERNTCGSPTLQVLESGGYQTYSWDVMEMGLQFSIENGLVREIAVRSKP